MDYASLRTVSLMFSDNFYQVNIEEREQDFKFRIVRDCVVVK